MEKPSVPRLFTGPDRPRRQLSGKVVAEGKVLKSNGLLGERGRRRCNSRLGVGQLLSTFQLGLHDAVFGRQVFVPRQQLLVHRPRHVSQDARPIRKRPLPYPDSATASWTVREIVLNRLRNYYRRRPNHCSPAVSVFWPYEVPILSLRPIDETNGAQ